MGRSKSRSGSKQTDRFDQHSQSLSDADLLAAKEQAGKITSVAQLRALEERYERALDRSMEAESEKSQSTAEKKAAILEKAVDIASVRTYLWQYVPDLELNTPISSLKYAYKTFPLLKIEEAKSQIRSDDHCWFDLDDPEDAEEQDIIFESLVKFRKVVESSTSPATQIKKINAICEQDRAFLEEYFDESTSLSPGEQWFADKLEQDGLPDAHEFYELGYNTPEKSLTINVDDYAKKKGVGPKRVEQLNKYISKVKVEIENA